MIAEVQHEPGRAPAGAPPGTGLTRVFTPSGCTMLVCSAAFAAALEQAVSAAKDWARQHGMQTADD